jgi:uncharacterized membrane protein YczE
VRGAWDRPLQRSLRLFGGLVLFGVALAALVEADLGLDPWTVFSQGVSERTGLSIGTVIILTSLTLLLTWIPLGQPPGIGTVANALVVGPVLDVSLELVPDPGSLAMQALYAAAAIVGIAVATGLYIGAGWGPGPRDGLMTAMHARGVPIAVARASIELTVLAIGWLLGGTVGVATVAFAIAIGPLVRLALRKLSLPPARAPSPARARAAAAGAEARSARP